MTLQELAKAKWKSSGISDNEAKKLKLTPVVDAKKLHSSFHGVGSLKIPYFDENGKPSEFYRIRYLEKLPGFLGSTAKPQRYAQAPGTLNEVYLPPLLPVSWSDVLEDEKVTIHITEGEFKAAAACSKGIATIGLGGVDVWRSSKRGLSLLPMLQKFKWKDRTCIILYDSDAATNSNVVRAQRQLAKELLNQGARPIIASLPPTPEGKKQGLDDFLLAHGKEALMEVINDAEPFDEAEALWEMNEECVYVMDPGVVINKDTGQRMKPEAFIRHHYATRTFLERTENSEGKTKISVKSTAERWIKWPTRFQLQSTAYEPGQPRVVGAEWNTWKGWGVEPKKGDVALWTWLLDYLFKNVPYEDRQWFERWCAYPLQNPGVKLYQSAVLWGVAQGTGKTLVGYLLKKIYGSNGIEIRNKDISGNFNKWAVNKQFVLGDEVTGRDGMEKRFDADKLKGFITQDSITINEKFMPEYTIRDTINYLFTSQHPDAFFLEDMDRRFFIHNVDVGPGPKEKYTALDSWMKGEGPSALFHHLLHLPMGSFEPRGHAPMTNAKKEMIHDNKSELSTWCTALKEDPYGSLRALGEAAAKGAELVTAGQLHRCYDPERASKVTVNGISRELKRSGFKKAHNGEPVMTKSMGTQRLFIIRNEEKWLKGNTKEMAGHFEKHFGPNSRKF